MKAGHAVPTNRVYSSNATDEAFKVIRAKNPKLRWKADTRARIHPNGRLVCIQLSPAEVKQRMGK